ncbi:MAG TPA: NUDIX hydrolase [Kiritimatiellia bacterium]|nr:NUDIX hydrolase [Kiritimatiellia bacterium]HNS81224.1 NUDIX hydrolase [Kiritimatiellia bacterium]HPA77735.1 NUDIX hydrolase [Kiritimatiellia bacterium]HQQ04981.1 NUDIX hydrolase [Kiritimatiellia bacterium]
MQRDRIIQQLEAYQAKWENESQTVRRLIDFIAAHEDFHSQALRQGHITGSAWLVNRAGTHVLLTHHRKLNKWIQLGGHADGDSDPLSAALREASEESGLEKIEPVSEEIFDVDIHEIAARENEPAHFHYDIRYALRAACPENYIVSDESHDLEWIKIDRLQDFTVEESVLRMAAKWKRRAGKDGGRCRV